MPQIQLKLDFCSSHQGIKRQAFCLGATQNQIFSSIVYKLARHDLSEVIQLFLQDKKITGPLKKNCSARTTQHSC